MAKDAARKAGRRSTTAFDKQVGRNIRARRTLLKMKQAELGALLGKVTYQQVQKYERGQDRIPTDSLLMCAVALDVPLTYFFRDMPKGAYDKAPASIRRILFGADMGTEDQTHREQMLIKQLRRVGARHGEGPRESVFTLVAALAGEEDES